MSRTFVFLSLLISLAFSGCTRQQQKWQAQDAELMEKAGELAQKFIIVDTHQDTPWRLEKEMVNLTECLPDGDFDYPRARQGGLDNVFMAVYVSPKYEADGTAKTYAEKTIDMVYALEDSWPDKFVIAKSPADIRKHFGTGAVSIALGIENGAPIEGDLANVRHFYDRGIRYITLVHSKCNHICDSSYDSERKWKGLSPFGRELIAEMNRVGMMIDVSHVCDKTFYQIMELSKTPVIASHSSCRKFTPGWERNMTDDMIKLLAEKGGVIQVNFGTMFINPDVNYNYVHRWDEIDAYIEKHKLQGEAEKKYIGRYKKKNPMLPATVKDVAANIDHVVKLVGIDYVGLGSDFDGVGEAVPIGLRDVSGFPNLIYELLSMGYSENDIEKICSGNFLRVWAEIQAAADGS